MTLHNPKVQFAELATSMEAGGILSIDLGAIASNWKKLASMTVPVECAAVVKADAYGCGLEPVARTLLAAGCRTFFVADFNEGRSLRAISPSATIYVLNGMVPGAAASFAEAALRPVINSTTELAEWDAFISGRSWRGGAALHVDTGMNRLGVSAEEAVALAPRLHSENHGFALLMSHLACADVPDHPMNDRQTRLFREIRILYRGVPSSLANSAGILRRHLVLRFGAARHCTLRSQSGSRQRQSDAPCHRTQGENPPGALGEPRRYGRLWCELDGRTIGAHRHHRGRPCRWFIAIGDGLQGKPAAEVVVAGRRCPVAGRISMDVTAVDVSDLPEGAARRGDFATLIGEGSTVDDLAAGFGTVNYEVLTNLGRRYHRVYREA